MVRKRGQGNQGPVTKVAAPGSPAGKSVVETVSRNYRVGYIADEQLLDRAKLTNHRSVPVGPDFSGRYSTLAQNVP